MTRFTKTLIENYLFLIFIILFLFVSILYVDRAFYWDEAWVYAPALRIMAESGPSLLPDAIPEFYSRGHPLLFHFLGGLWLKVFGTSFISFHSFALLISVIFLVVVYTTIKEWSNSAIALATAALVAFNKTFFAEAANVMPEVMVALFSILSIKYYLKSKFFLYFVFAGLLMLTKESGVVIPAILGLSFVGLKLLRNQKIEWKKDLTHFSFILSPYVVFIIFMVVQYMYKGWFLFPEHTGMVQLSFPAFLEKFQSILKWILEEDRRYWITAILTITFIYKNASKQDTFLILISSLIALFFIFYNPLNSITLFILASMLLILVLQRVYKIYDINSFSGNLQQITIAFFFIIIYLIFSALNFFTIRYIIAILPFIFYLISALLYKNLVKNRLVFPITISILLATMIPINFSHSKEGSLVSQNDYVELRLTLVRDLESRNIFQERMGVPDFVIRRILEDNKIGFLSKNDTFQNLSWDVKDASFIVVNNYDNYPEILKSNEYKLVKRWEKGIHWIELWHRNQD